MSKVKARAYAALREFIEAKDRAVKYAALSTLRELYERLAREAERVR